jgi:putative oxidoreductase
MKLQSYGLTVLRVVLGIIFFAHGYQKLFKFGFHGVAGMFGHMGIPLPLFFAVVVSLVEFVGGILLIAGIAVQVSAALIAIDMSVAILKAHLPHGFWAKNDGFEWPLMLLASAVCLALAGGGAWSLKR